MDGLARSARRAALVSVAAASVLFACVLVWHLMPGGSMGHVATWTLAAVLALVLLPIASLVAWEVDRRAAARAAKVDLDRALRDWARLTACDPKTGVFGMDSVSVTLVEAGQSSRVTATHIDQAPSTSWSRTGEPVKAQGLDAKGATMSAAPLPRVEATDFKGDSQNDTKAKDNAPRPDTRSEPRNDASRVREPAPTPRRVTHPHRRAVRNR